MSSEESPSSRGAVRFEWAILLSVFVLGFLIISARRPDALLNPQFYAEDGRYWYAQAHDLGPLRALFIPHRGYLVIMQRLGAWVSMAVPLEWAPLVFNLLAIAVQTLPAVLISSARFSALVPRLSGRLFLAFLYLNMPNVAAVMSNLTHTMWFLAPLACMVVLAAPSRRIAWRVFDVAAVALAGLSGPFGLFLTPIAALKWSFRRDRWTLVLTGVAGSTAAIQCASILLTPTPPGGRMPLGASAVVFVKLFVKRVIYGALFGQSGGTKILLNPTIWTRREVLILVALCGLAMLAFAMLRGPLELRLFILYAALLFCGALAWPGGQTSPPTTWWDLLMPAGNGNRYFVTPILAFLATCAWMLSLRSPPARLVGALTLAIVFAYGVRLDWREGAYRDWNFRESVKEYKRAPVGEKVVIMTPPDWDMVLTKREADQGAVEPEECTRELSVAPRLLASNQMTWTDGVGRAQAGDPYAIFDIPAAEPVCAIRIKYILTNPGGTPAGLQAFWAKSGENDFVANERNSSVLVRPGPFEQTTTFRVNDTIDRLRIDPDIRECDFRLLEIVLLLRPNGGTAELQRVRP